MKCPYCKVNEEDCVPAVVYRNAEGHGGGVVNFHCLACGKVVKVYAMVKIEISQAKKTDDESDWGECH